jgi:ATP-binding cassette subfamily B protein
MKKTEQKALAMQTLRLYWQHAWKHKGFVIGLLISLPLTILIFQFLPPLIVANILQKISDHGFTEGHLWESFGPQLVWFGVLTVLGGMVLWRLNIWLIWKLENKVLFDINRRVFAHMLNLSATFHANRFGGSLVSQTGKFASAYIRIADTTVFQVSNLVLSFIFTAIILVPKAPLVALLILGFSVLFITISVFATKDVRALNAEEAEKENTQTGYLADVITNILAVKSFASGMHERKRFKVAAGQTRQAADNVMWGNMKKDVLFSGLTSTLEVGTLVIAIAGVVLFKADIATVFLVVTYTTNISRSLWEFAQSTLRNYNRALGDAREMTKILDIQPGVKDPAKPEKSRISKGAIQLVDMSFDHQKENDDDALFNKLNLTITPGEKIGLVGRSGSGKTSLTKLLLRFNDIDDGQILIDGQNITHITQDDLRSAIAYVPQEPLLFHRSIHENIAYGQPTASDAEIREAARKANAADFIDTLSEGYETLVGERGVKLSGGQRQRIAIARAILKDAPILILDEATSALDSESEKLIQDALRQLMENRTSIVIAHRLSTIQKMDRILVMENGEIIEEGTHKSLVDKGGTYAALWAHQSGGFIEE